MLIYDDRIVRIVGNRGAASVRFSSSRLFAHAALRSGAISTTICACCYIEDAKVDGATLCVAIRNT